MSKISDDLFFIFSHFPKFYQDFSCYFRKLPPENSDDLFFSHFSQFLFLFPYLFFLNIIPDAPLILDTRGRSSLFTHLPLLLQHLPVHFFRKLRRWMPPGWMPGAVAPFASPSARHCSQGSPLPGCVYEHTLLFCCSRIYGRCCSAEI